MKVLWITNIKFPAVCRALGEKEPVIGGWMYSLSSELVKEPTIQLAVATVYSGSEIKEIKAGNITFYLVPSKKDYLHYDRKLEQHWLKIKDLFAPDLVHIHGTETPYGLAYLKACGNSGVLISIQGLLSVISKYYYANISAKEILRNITIRDIIKFDNIFQQKNKFQRRGKFEIQSIKQSMNFIGRTSWDKSHVLAVNANANYFFCNETIRPIFYNNKWEYEKCKKHTIFISQSLYPIKGLHQVLKAMPLILNKFPNARIVVSGYNITNKSDIKSKIRLSGYGKYILSLIKKHNLKNHVEFIGECDEKRMLEQYLKANVFVCPSSIENSPNSLAEAQLLGVPVVAAYVGGIPDMITHKLNGYLYRFEEIEMLAEFVCEIFEKGENSELSENEQLIANNRHSNELNNKQLSDIYKSIISCNFN